MILHVVRVRQLIPEPRRLIRLHGRTAGSLHEQAREFERLVTDHLCRQPQPRGMRQQSVFGIALRSFSSQARRLAVGLARHDRPQQALHVPARAHELDRQPVEQRGMGGRLALGTEVVESFHEPRAKEHLPVAVHGHAGRKRVPGRDQPLGKCQAVLHGRLVAC